MVQGLESDVPGPSFRSRLEELANKLADEFCPPRVMAVVMFADEIDND